MKILLLFFTLILAAACSSNRTTSEGPLSITEIHPNKMTELTRKHLVALTKKHDLSPFLYSDKVQIESYVTPHSHPVITLNTRSAKSQDKVLSKLLHEEFHWWAVDHSEKTDVAIEDLRTKFPTIPGQEEILENKSKYLHLVINWLEYKALVKYLGEDRALKVIQETIKVDKIYPRIYTFVLKKQKEIGPILKKHNLIPEALL